MTDPGKTRNGSQELARREQSLALEFTQLTSHDTLEVYKTFSIDEDYTRYGSLDWAFQAYHGGEGGVAKTVSTYLGGNYRSFGSPETHANGYSNKTHPSSVLLEPGPNFDISADNAGLGFSQAGLAPGNFTCRVCGGRYVIRKIIGSAHA